MSVIIPLSSPPSYTPVEAISDDPPSLDDQQEANLGSQLPTYANTVHRGGVSPATSSTPSSVKEFTFSIKNRGKSLAVLTVIANRNVSNTMPTFIEGQPIKGSVRLNLGKAEAFQSVTIRVRGNLFSRSGHQTTFLDTSHIIWSQSMGDPRHTASKFTLKSPNRPESNTSIAATTPFTGKIVEGEYFWEFSIELPKEVPVPVGKDRNPKIFLLAQTFAERHIHASVAYEMVMKVTTTNFLRMNHRTLVQLGFIPVTRPPPFPPLRTLAYQEGSPLLPPSVDPDGWQALEPVKFRGLLFKSITVELECTLYLAKPLVYTRSTCIPLYLEFSGENAQALSLLSAPKAVACYLRRYVKFDDDAMVIKEPISTLSLEGTPDKLMVQDSVMNSQLAVWWKPDTKIAETNYLTHCTCLLGELHLGSNLKPTTALGWFEIKYSVVLLPFEVAGFDPETSIPLIKKPVEIVTAFAPGPRPRMSAPPGYKIETTMHLEAPNIGGTAAMMGMSDMNFIS
ncbi:hypothetical protein CPB83DRAFT_894250 [Crepidotus variabilis]|uniref:Arrestin-like N-terminal domain-containing protein n=1 Tax=Crepidotus variabilis TaxID=179855 RepID=A0A9P6EGH9_9AGAR|nr:hypothetical protein CPB83DRAFT_894250 [Crepidotus variabilis]